jgi:hypothetical protein
LLAGLAENLRSELWRQVGLSEPLDRAQLMPWVLARVGLQDREGDRLRLYLPANLARAEWAKQREAAIGQRVAAMMDQRILPVRRGSRGVFWVDAFAGRYLEDDLGDLAASAWPSVFRRPDVKHLALLALAEREVHRVTGCDLEDGLLFLLCDVACGRPFRWSLSLVGGLRLWAYDAFMPGDELRANYVAARRLFMPRTRAKRPEVHTLELIQLVGEMRPSGGRRAGNATWLDVLERWNAEHSRKKHYTDTASISRAYAQALRRRKELGLL